MANSKMIRNETIRLTDFKRNSKMIREIRGKDIAMIFQDPMTSLNPVYTIGSQISENLRKHEKISKEEAKARVIKLLEDLGIPSLPPKKERLCAGPRIGIDYAEEARDFPWRFWL